LLRRRTLFQVTPLTRRPQTSHALTPTTLTRLLNKEVVGSQLVAADAMRPGSALTTQRILKIRDRLKVLRIAAGTHPAEVVDL
jgi:hypothetical protein